MSIIKIIITINKKMREEPDNEFHILEHFIDSINQSV